MSCFAGKDPRMMRKQNGSLAAFNLHLHPIEYGCLSAIYDSLHDSSCQAYASPDPTKQACTMYVITGGAVAPPRVLKASLRSRTSRAAMRTFGLQALAALLRSLSPEKQAGMSVGASSAVQVSYILRAVGCCVTTLLLMYTQLTRSICTGASVSLIRYCRLRCTLVQCTV